MCTVVEHAVAEPNLSGRLPHNLSEVSRRRAEAGVVVVIEGLFEVVPALCGQVTGIGDQVDAILLLKVLLVRFVGLVVPSRSIGKVLTLGNVASMGKVT